jgi:hypothetical protein
MMMNVFYLASFVVKDLFKKTMTNSKLKLLEGLKIGKVIQLWDLEV